MPKFQPGQIIRWIGNMDNHPEGNVYFLVQDCYLNPFNNEEVVTIAKGCYHANAGRIEYLAKSFVEVPEDEMEKALARLTQFEMNGEGYD